MSFARFLNFGQTDYSGVTGFTPNLDLLKNLTDSHQAEIDLADAILDKMPQSRDANTELVRQLADDLASKRDAVADTYANQGVPEGSRSLRDFKRSAAKLWRPGGAFERVQRDYNDWMQADKTLRDQIAKGSVEQDRGLIELNNLRTQNGIGIQGDDGRFATDRFNDVTFDPSALYVDVPTKLAAHSKNIKSIMTDYGYKIQTLDDGTKVFVDQTGEVVSRSRAKDILEKIANSDPAIKSYIKARNDAELDGSQDLINAVDAISNAAQSSKINRKTQIIPLPREGSGIGNGTPTATATESMQATDHIITSDHLNIASNGLMNKTIMGDEEFKKEKGKVVGVYEVKSAKDTKGAEDLYENLESELGKYTAGFLDLQSGGQSLSREMQEKLKNNFVFSNFSERWPIEDIDGSKIQKEVTNNLNEGFASNPDLYNELLDMYMEETKIKEKREVPRHEAVVTLDHQIDQIDRLIIDPYNQMVVKKNRADSKIRSEINKELSNAERLIFNGEDFTPDDLVSAAINSGFEIKGNVGKAYRTIKDNRENIERWESELAQQGSIDGNPLAQSARDRLEISIAQAQDEINKRKNIIDSNSINVKDLREHIYNSNEKVAKARAMYDIYKPVATRRAVYSNFKTLVGDINKQNLPSTNKDLIKNSAAAAEAHYYDNINLINADFEFKDNEATVKTKGNTAASGFGRVIAYDLDGNQIPEEEVKDYLGITRIEGMTTDDLGRWLVVAQALPKDTGEKARTVLLYDEARSQAYRNTVRNISSKDMRDRLEVEIYQREQEKVREGDGDIANLDFDTKGIFYDGLKVNIKRNPDRTDDNGNPQYTVQVQDYSGQNILPSAIKSWSLNEISSKLAGITQLVADASYDPNVDFNNGKFYNDSDKTASGKGVISPKVSKRFLTNKMSRALTSIDGAFASFTANNPNYRNAQYVITSMTRSYQENERVEGVNNSGHLFGNGIDIAYSTEFEEFLKTYTGGEALSTGDSVPVTIGNTSLKIFRHGEGSKDHYDIKLAN